MPHGGARKGAGRKARDESGAAAPTTVWLSPGQRERLAAVAKALPEAFSDVMERGIKAAEAALRRRKR